MHFIYFRLCLPCICIYIQIKLVHEFFQILFPCLSDKSKFGAQLNCSFFSPPAFLLQIIAVDDHGITNKTNHRRSIIQKLRSSFFWKWKCKFVFVKTPESAGFYCIWKKQRNAGMVETSHNPTPEISPKNASQFNCHSWMFIRSFGSLGPGSTSLNPMDCIVRDCNPTQKKKRQVWLSGRLTRQDWKIDIST